MITDTQTSPSALATAFDPAPVGANLPDILTVAKVVRASGFSRETIQGAMDRGELEWFRYGRNVCVRRAEYVRWINSLETYEREAS